MNLGRLSAVFGRDLAHNSRRAMFYIWLALVIFLAWGLSSGKVRIQSGDSSVGGTKSFITSEFAVAQILVLLAPLVYGFFTAVIAGMTVIHDEECRVGEVLHATPLRPGEYIWGKFLAVLASIGAILGLHLASMILFNHAIGGGDSQEFRGPLHLTNYLRPALLFAMPTLVFFAGVSFAIGERTRKPILVFFLPVAVFLGCIFFLWDWSPSWLDPRIDRFLMLIDPAGFRWLQETQLKVDRGVTFYNTRPIPMDGTIIANRLLFLAIGLGAVALSHRHFAASLRGISRRAERTWKARASHPEDRRESLAVSDLAAPPARPLAVLEMTSRRPGLFAGAWAVMWAEVAELRSSPGLYLFVPLLILEAVGPNLLAVGAFDTPLLLTSGTFAVRTFSPLVTMTCLLLLFYTVESLWRERQTRLAAISLATPIRTGSILLGKAMANSLVGVSVIFLEFAVAAAMLLYQRKVGVEILPFGLIWGVLLVPTLFLWTSFVMATLSLTRNRYATYAIALGVLIFTGYRQIIGEINWVGNWPLWGAVQWSDISVLEFDRGALVLNRVMVVSLAVLFTVLTTRWYGRRDPDATGLLQRLRPIALLRAGLWLLPVAVIPIAAGSILWARVDRGYQGKSAKKLMKDYWRKNLSTYKDWPLAEITAVDVAVTLDPDRGRLKVSGTYDLINNQEKPVAQIPITGGLHWESPTWTLDGQDFKPDNRAGLFVFTPPSPLPPGGTARLGFRFEGAYPHGISKNGGGSMEFILPSGVVLTSFGTSFVPAIGFSEDVGIDDENKYESKEYPDDYYLGQTDSFAGSRRPYKTKVAITGPDRFAYNSVGQLTSDSTRDGLRTSVWESDQPVNFFNIVAGDWEVRRGDGTAVYHSAKHPYNVDEMVEALDAARKYYSEWFHPYPWKELKLSEFPALAGYAQGFPTDITFSESIGFLTESDPRANAAFMVTAHESAHQWWGNIVAPGKGPGGNLVSEGTSHFSTLLLFDQVKGPRSRIEFAKKIEDSYAKSRSSDSERPLVKTDGSRDGDQAVTYDKTGFVLWMLLNQMGRDRMLAGIRDFFETYHANPDHPVLQDLLASLRPHAEDPEAFDAFTRQWFFEVVIPEYQLADFKKVKEGDAWVATARITNVGTGRMPVEVAATRGERFPEPDAKPKPEPYQEARQTLTLGAGDSAEIRIRVDFEPEQLVVDPDARVLMLRRKSAVAR
ncbi:M1 family aminopeptidase [Tundrisphaera lichenicola]|uniref:ABC transporter permease/M1 family aminopeptidase n=1 Tax=Tundrisphaera lichenicola TaxID=2029860 RepID=UPI003EBE1346